jgi:cyclopropane fatty-acyl-phospholipid synthase-like methyltransferase
VKYTVRNKDGEVAFESRAELQNAARTGLVLQSTDDFGLHYGETLRRWRANFNAALDAVVRPLGFDDAFIRTWNYYLCYCEAGFSSQTLGLHVLTFARPGTSGLWAGERHGALARPLDDA